MGMVTSLGTQQGTVPKWHQASACASCQLPKALEVVILLGSDHWVQTIVGGFLQAECCKVLAE